MRQIFKRKDKLAKQVLANTPASHETGMGLFRYPPGTDALNRADRLVCLILQSIQT